jgi:hypothetical protein
MGEAAFVAEQGDLARERIVKYLQRCLMVSLRRFLIFMGWFASGEDWNR